LIQIIGRVAEIGDDATVEAPPPPMPFDVVIVGAGPAGLCFARSLAGTGLNVALVEAQDGASLAGPAFDGREIALTHHSVHLLRQLGLWEHIPAKSIHPLRDAQVLDGGALAGMRLDHADGNQPQLGFLVSNHLIRRAAFAAITGQDRVNLMCGRRVVGLEPGRERSRVRLSDGQSLTTRLVVAADSRFSETRRAMGIAADSHDFGKTMMVCRMQHERPHQHVAWEWFDYGQTLALLPLAEHQSSVVVTLPHVEIERLMTAPAAEFAAAIADRFHQRLGRMSLASTRHAYPLVGVYPRRFTGARFALIGDAAVGMHPVTAHGFNFGLLGQDLLARAIRREAAAHADVAGPLMLAQFERDLRRATRPLYLATSLIARLYTDDRPPVRFLRRVALSAGAGLRPLQRALIHSLTQAGDSREATYPLLGLLRALRP
jgi:ubiquinone biosynthesis UbiH/UbiF/VisC/COQ6 family hydroxylase